MSISGGCKFFAENAALSAGGGIVSVTSGSVVSANLIDKLAYTYWTSVGSSDSTAEVLVLTFASTSLSRLLLLDHNWKDYVVKYWNGAAWTHFASVVGLDPANSASSLSMTNITETAFVDDSSYYEFTPVTTTSLQITVNKTQVANAEKYIATVFPTTEIGTLSGYPAIVPLLQRNCRTTKMLSGRKNIVKQPQVSEISVDFTSYPVRDYGADVDLMLTLIDRETPFYIWPCGGRRGTKYFSYSVRGWRLRDCPRVQVDSDFAAEWSNAIYTSGLNPGTLVFSEHV